MPTIAVGIAELHIPAARSLKDKRRVVKSLIERLHRSSRLSVAETGFFELHQRAEITLAGVASASLPADQILDRARDLLDREVAASVSSWHGEILDLDNDRNADFDFFLQSPS